MIIEDSDLLEDAPNESGMQAPVMRNLNPTGGNILNCYSLPASTARVPEMVLIKGTKVMAECFYLSGVSAER